MALCLHCGLSFSLHFAQSCTCKDNGVRLHFPQTARAEQMNSRYLSDVQVTLLYKWRAAELPGIGRQLPDCHELCCALHVQVVIKHRAASVSTVPPAGRYTHQHIQTWRHETVKSKNTSLDIITYHTYVHPAPHVWFYRQQQPPPPPPGRRDFHTNYCCHGNWLKEVIT